MIKRVHRVQKNKEEMIDTKRYVLPEVSDIQTGKLTALPFTHKIMLGKDRRPVVNATRRVPVVIQDKLNEELEGMVKLRVIESGGDNRVGEQHGCGNQTKWKLECA